ncbi:uncharacterized protein si:dkey-92i15.4 [Scomber scombrus]|uniref:Uncharacterized protein si:dkey-92i15.4 n=1 Tax=Scomber scombrus TaxID=13677 RepID=A0AAV1NMI4_SCOSC
MDLSLLPTPVSEHNSQRAGARFTVRPANSPSYSITRRPGVRKPRDFSEEERESVEEAGEREIYRKNICTNGANKKDDTVTGYQTRTDNSDKGQCESLVKETSSYKLSTMLYQNGTADKNIIDFGVDRSHNPASESQGKTEWRGYDLASRSKSLDWRTRARSPDRSPDMSCKQGGDISKQGRIGLDGVRGRLMSAINNSSGTSNVQERIPVSYMTQTLDRVRRDHSLPSRLRPQSGPGSGFRETASSVPKGGQSISDRIEKLYGSAGFSKTEDYSKIRDFSTSVRDWCEREGQATMSHCKGSTPDFHISSQQRSYEKGAGGTFPRRFSSVEKCSPSPVEDRTSFTCTTQKEIAGSDHSISPRTSRNKERTQEGQWQDQIHSRYSEEGGVNWGRGLVETGTMSLDRARSKCTVASQIRSIRAAGGITAPPQSNTSSEEISFGGPSETRKRRASGSKDLGRANHGEVKGETLRERTRIEGGVLNSSNADEDDEVFDSNPQRIRMKTVERNTFPEKPAASVRNKINQFEALTQRSQGIAADRALMTRRTFSVPTQQSRGQDGVKKSASAKAIGGLKNKWVGLREGGEKADEKVTGVGKKLGSERSLSVDVVGLRLGNKETGGNYLAEKEGKSTDSGNNWTSDFGKYSELKHTLEIPLNEGAQQRCRNFYVDKSDFSKVSSPEETHNKDMTDNNAASGLLSNSRESLELCGVKKMTPSGITPPVSDDDKTPTNTPNHSPFLSPQNATPNAETENKSTSLLTQATTTHPETDSPPLLRPLATSSHSNLHDLISPDASTAYPKGKKQAFDLDAWLAGLNSKIKVWNDDEDDYEDDDESTQKDEDSNYDSDSGESSVTITSNMSQSDRRSFCVSLSDLCNFAGVDYESENDSDEGQSTCQRTASLSSDVSALSCVSIMPSEELDRLLEDVRGLGDNTLQDYNDVQVVVLHKEVGVGLGFSVAGGVDQNKPVTVHKVFHSGVAAQEGSISEGDQVLSINGTALCDFAHWEALRVLRRAKTREMGVVVLRKGGVSNISKGGAQINNQGLTQTQITETGQRVCVSLVKNSRDLGFSLEGGVGSRLGNRPLSIQKIFQGGPFDKVFPGDEVVEIEGISVVGMRRLEAWTLIRQLPPGPVDVILCRSITHLET